MVYEISNHMGSVVLKLSSIQVLALYWREASKPLDIGFYFNGFVTK